MKRTIGHSAPRSTPPHVAQERTRLAMAGMARFMTLVTLVTLDNAYDAGQGPDIVYGRSLWDSVQAYRARLIATYTGEGWL